jgi:hypothetical protein
VENMSGMTGGCSCGAVRYVVKADPILMLNCHCRDCQRASGSAYAAIVVVPRAAVELTGELRYHKITGDNGGVIERGFCPSCGSRIANKLGRMPDILGLMAGNLDDPALHKPAMDIFTASAHPWDRLAPETTKFERNLMR